MITYLILLLCITSLGLLLRYLFSSGKATDEWVSLWNIKRQCKRKWITYEVKDSVIKGFYGYPILLHFLISKFPKKYWIKVGLLLNSLFDILTAIIGYLFAELLKYKGIIEFPYFSLLSYSIILLSPTFFPPLTSRLKTIKARSFGSLLTTIYFSLCSIYYIDYINYLTTSILLFVLSWAIINSSMFALQALVFFALGLFCFGYFTPLTIFLGSTFILFLIPRSGVKEVLVWYIQHKFWYFRNAHHGTTASPRGHATNYFNTIKTFKNGFWGALKNIYNKTPLINFVLVAPTLIILFFFLIISNKTNFCILFENSIVQYFLIWFLSCLIFFFITSFKPFLFLGQSERYFEYAVIPLHFVFVISIYNTEHFKNIILICLCLNLIIILTNYLLFTKTYAKNNNDNYNDITEIMEHFQTNYSLKGNHIYIATFPVKLSFLFSYNKPHLSNIKFYYRFIKRPNEKHMNYLEKDTGGGPFGSGKNFNFFSLPLNKLYEKYGITHLIVYNEHLPNFEEVYFNKKIPFDFFIDFKNDHYTILRYKES